MITRPDPYAWTESDLPLLDAVPGEWLAADPEGVGCVIGTGPVAAPETPRVHALPPEHAQGLEFEPVVLLAPGSFGDVVAGRSTGTSPRPARPSSWWSSPAPDLACPDRCVGGPLAFGP